MGGYRDLTKEEIKEMENFGCSAEDWSRVKVREGFDPGRVHNISFIGDIRIGLLKGQVTLPDGQMLNAELRNATLIECELGDNVRVTNIGSHISHYTIEAGVVVTDVGSMATVAGATFGNGVALDAVNEGGGREVRIFNEMSSQFAYLLTMHRYRPEMIRRMDLMIDAYVEGVTSDRGWIGEGAMISHVTEIRDVNVGPFARVSGASKLRNGTILSEAIAPTRVGSAVVADDFIIGEGSTVDSGAQLDRCFVGQGVEIGKLFTAENSLFFSNSECLHGEACSAFAGPYTVTHHKSTLLIAGLFSFFNAGSGTNQSNHMYKLGPIHQGVLERGSKMGSFSYLIWPSLVGPFSVVIGKHMTNFEIGDLPFSYVTEEGGESYLTPAMNLFSVGTRRDAWKWPTRDKRKSTEKRDLIRFEVFSPYVVQKMIRAEALLTKFYQETPKKVEKIRYNGVIIKRLLLRHGSRNYSARIKTYLNAKILDRVAPVQDRGIEAIRTALAKDEGCIDCKTWADVSGLLIAGDRLKALEDDIESGRISDVSEFQAAFKGAFDAYSIDEWAWVRRTFEERDGKSVDDLSVEGLNEMRAAQRKDFSTSMKKILADAEKEFGEEAKFGYGADGGHQERESDFTAVRGELKENDFVKRLQEEMEREAGE